MTKRKEGGFQAPRKKKTATKTTKYIDVAKVSLTGSVPTSTKLTTAYAQKQHKEAVSEAGRERRIWNNKEMDLLIECMEVELNKGGRDENHKLRGIYRKLEKAMKVKLPNAGITNIHINSKIKNWRGWYNLVSSILKVYGKEWRGRSGYLDIKITKLYHPINSCVPVICDYVESMCFV